MSDCDFSNKSDHDPLIRQVAAAFVSEPVRVLPLVRQGRKTLRPAFSSGISNKFFLETAARERFVLKEAPAYANSLPFCQASLQFQQHLSRDGLLIPEYCCLSDDHTRFHLVQLEDGRERIFTLQRLADGGDFPCLPSLVRGAVDALHSLHTSALSLPDNHLPHGNVFDCVTDLLAQGRDELETKLNGPWRPYKTEVLALISAFSWQVNHYKSQAESAGYFERTQAVHGDFHLNNLLFNDRGTVSAILDFDDAKNDNPIQDFARLTVSLCVFKFHRDPQRPLAVIPTSVDVPLLLELLAHSKNIEILQFLKGPFVPTLKCIALQMAFIGLLCGMYGTDQLRELRLFPAMLDAGCNQLDALIKKEHLHGLS
ncbi:aminoglycoside phosphotransferase family protein [Pseudomonas fluorescens]|uniref:aminoglycoside phosphotransferase family protein n=1 Tax=Pseudomonas TaxID=286 RepID=UPI000812AE7F|nr:aminoglycoside phosphotransferase family protein [Pseudomonas sp. 37 R 15]MBD8099225.1 aminoglycoside phosphotransferase family protein [Pseudomonas fluorescens]MBD8774144.1 aminoglycoside phosphotransferase family protein [Pseudomonas fluorescens]MBD8780826.1 aminoglycoside phosphotransferase family protein [Pseudomonas fluorescens]MBD8796703.1 aminoglycoside phosphotransferase family protein [Pseudomonas fluorescens]CRM79519.1 Phosphotransferase enzyme family protein [Pseudomonas sp. 37 R